MIAESQYLMEWMNDEIWDFDWMKMMASNETILIENHLKCAKQIKQIILFFFDEIFKKFKNFRKSSDTRTSSWIGIITSTVEWCCF